MKPAKYMEEIEFRDKNVDGTKFFEPIITELGIMDTSSVKYQRPIRWDKAPGFTNIDIEELFI